MIRDHTLRLLEAYRAFDDLERAYYRDICAFVRSHEESHRRSHASGHVTGSSWVVDREGSHALLVHHRRLERWLQPGGHLEDDVTVLEAALREAREETGLVCIPVSEDIFDIDIHRIPANARESEHLHYDIRFLLVADRDEMPTVSSESREVRWFNWDQIHAMACGPSIDRMVQKCRARDLGAITHGNGS